MKNAQTILQNAMTIQVHQVFLKEKLAHGGFGVVYKGIWQGITVAVKVFLARSTEAEHQSLFENEVTRLFELRSSHIVGIYGYCESPRRIIMEYMPKGSLYQVLHQPQEPLSWELRIRIARDMSAGLAFLHHKQVLHGDIKSSNILLNEAYEAKLSDFGLSSIHDLQRTTAKGVVGTLAWTAPELSIEGGVYSPASDVYSLGITFWEIAARTLPFKNLAGPPLIQYKLARGGPGEIPPDCPSKLAGLIKACAATRPDERPSAEEILRFMGSEATDFRTFLPGYRASVLALSMESAFARAYHVACEDYNQCRYQEALNAFLSLSTDPLAPYYLPACIKVWMIYQQAEGILFDPVRADHYGGIVEKKGKWFLEQATDPCQESCYNLGILYLEGHGVGQDDTQARFWLEKAAMAGHVQAQCRLGALELVLSSREKAQYWLERAATLGHVDAQCVLGVLYQHPTVFANNEARAQFWLEQGASKGDLRAHCGLGWMYYHGRGVVQDVEQAKEWFEKAALQGDSDAQEALVTLGFVKVFKPRLQ